MTHAAAPHFDERAEQIRASLPRGIDQRRLDLLPRVLNHWSVTDLLEHLSREDRATVRKRYDQLENVGKYAQPLQHAFGALDERGRIWLAQEMGLKKGDLHLSANRAEDVYPKERLKEEYDFLTKVAAGAQRLVEESKKEREGAPKRPPNLRAYLVMMDLAAIYEWLTGTKPTRKVSRIDYKDTGPFWKFCSAVWPLVFGKGCSGLPAALKRWAELLSEHGEKSCFLVNLAMRHPQWGIFRACTSKSLRCWCLAR
jgi:hypothetical protein